MKASEKLFKLKQQRILTNEIQRLDAQKRIITQVQPSRRSSDQQKFLDGVDETIQKLERELMEL